jgi:hypothetical protein
MCPCSSCSAIFSGSGARGVIAAICFSMLSASALAAGA